MRRFQCEFNTDSVKPQQPAHIDPEKTPRKRGVLTLARRDRLQRVHVALVGGPRVHLAVRLAPLLRQLVPVLRLRQQLADGALRQAEHVLREQPLPDVVRAEDLADVLRDVRRVEHAGVRLHAAERRRRQQHRWQQRRRRQHRAKVHHLSEVEGGARVGAVAVVVVARPSRVDGRRRDGRRVEPISVRRRWRRGAGGRRRGQRGRHPRGRRDRRRRDWRWRWRRRWRRRRRR